MRLYRCECGAVPSYEGRQVCEDTCEGEFYCPKCGARPNEPVEHTWGGMEMKELAAQTWNDWRWESHKKAAGE